MRLKEAAERNDRFNGTDGPQEIKRFYLSGFAVIYEWHLIVHKSLRFTLFFDKSFAAAMVSRSPLRTLETVS